MSDSKTETLEMSYQNPASAPPSYTAHAPPPPPPPMIIPQGTLPPVQPQTVIIQHTNIEHQSALSANPYNTICPNCRCQVVTKVEYTSGGFTWIICLLLAIFGCVLGCCLIPFCVNSTKDAIHTCPRCNVAIGKYSRL